MDNSTVQASINEFEKVIAAAGLRVSLVENGDEDWITPFLTTLAPPS
jgi:hypothetical protein